MRNKPEQLTAELKKGLKPIYVVAGDEPLQLGEMADAIRKAARLAGYDNREVISVDANFEWNQLAFLADSMSIFSDKKIIDLRLPSGAPGIEGAKALVSYCGRLQEDNLLLITAGKLASSALKSRWFEALDKQGVVIQVWPLEGQDLINWLQQRLRQRGLSAESDGLRLLASRVEGNLLAAAQEIEKLYVLYGAGSLNQQQILDVVADNSRYDVFKLIDSALSDREDRIVRWRAHAISIRQGNAAGQAQADTGPGHVSRGTGIAPDRLRRQPPQPGELRIPQDQGRGDAAGSR